MDATEVLRHDHRVVEQLFRDYRAAKSDAQRRGVVEIIVRELSKHAALEEVLFYPFAARVLADGQVDRHLAGHAPIKQLLLELDRCRVGNRAQDELMERLGSAVARHVQDDESELMPLLCSRTDEQALRELGQGDPRRVAGERLGRCHSPGERAVNCRHHGRLHDPPFSVRKGRTGQPGRPASPRRRPPSVADRQR